MGLDMYLKAGKYVSGYDHQTEESKADYKRILESAGLDETITKQHAPSLTVNVTVAYWRKANHIHAWFVENVQDGVDECQNAGVSREQLQELVALCKTALENKDKAKDVLPTRQGFFFGSTDYDEVYFQDCQDTADMLIPLLSEPKLAGWSFEYHSSW